MLDVTNRIGTWTTKQLYSYDSLNRLDSTTETNGSTLTYWTEDNAYDRYGNRWEVISGVPSLTFNTANNRISSAGYAYDASGNLTNDTVHTYGFDAENRLKSVDGVANSYVYDGEGKRIKKYFPQGEQVRFVYGISGQLLAEFDTTNGVLEKEYVYGAGGLLAAIEPVNGTKYMTADHLGSPRVVTGSTGAVISRHDYLPFGEEVGVGVGGRTASQGYGQFDGNRKKWAKLERDDETGLDYAQARYYSSAQGRFTSPDEFTGGPDELYDFVDDASDNPTFYATLTNPQSLNKYQYAYNNPLRYIDPNGHEADDLLDQDPQEGQQQQDPKPAPPPRKPYGLQPDDPQRTKERLDTYEALDECERGDCRKRDALVPPVPIPPLVPSPPTVQPVAPQAPPSPTGARHKKRGTTSPSKREKHQRGDERRGRDYGGEKGDERRRPPRRPPGGKTPKGGWPPKPPKPPEPPKPPDPKKLLDPS